MSNDMWKRYAEHLPSCNRAQNWDEAYDAFANTPNQFRDHEYNLALEELDEKRNTCTCGLDELLKSESPSPLSGEEIKPFDSAGVRVHFLLNLKKAQLMEYIYDFAWHYGRLYHIGDAEKIKEAIKEKFQLPEEFLYELLNSDQKAQASVATKVDSSTSDGKQNNSSNSGEQQQVTGDDLNELMPETKEALAKLAEKHNKQQRNLDKVELQMSDQTLTIAKLQAGELYWKQRCLLVEECYQKLNLSEEHKKQYAEWQQVKNQEVEPGQQLWNEIEKLENSMMMKGGNADGEKLKWFIENVKVLIKNQEVEPGQQTSNQRTVEGL